MATLDELDQYTYYVAGCVGEFWTRMVCAHRPAMVQWDVAQMSAIGVPDRNYGEELVAWVRLREGATMTLTRQY